jgi:hypothetical protein
LKYFGSVTQKPAPPAVREAIGACLGRLGRRRAARFWVLGQHAALWLRFRVFTARGVASFEAGRSVCEPGSSAAGCVNKDLLRPASPSQAPTAPCPGPADGREAACLGALERFAARWLRLRVFPARGVASFEAGHSVCEPGFSTGGCANKDLLRPASPSQAPMAPCPGRSNGREAAPSRIGRAVRGFVCGSRLHAWASAAAVVFGHGLSSATAGGPWDVCTRSNQALSRTPGRKGLGDASRVDSQASVRASLAGHRLAPR